MWRGQAADPQTIELANPYRGSYRWQDDAPQPPAWPIRDSYRRVTWRELEPTQGNYDFSRIDEGIATARANGGVFGFRVQAACTGCAAGGLAVPDYLKDLMPKGFWFRLNNTSNYAPDWNDPDYLSRLDALLHALGQRYGNDPRVGFVDISSYGDYGEWHRPPMALSVRDRRDADHHRECRGDRRHERARVSVEVVAHAASDDHRGRPERPRRVPLRAEQVPARRDSE